MIAAERPKVSSGEVRAEGGLAPTNRAVPSLAHSELNFRGANDYHPRRVRNSSRVVQRFVRAQLLQHQSAWTNSSHMSLLVERIKENIIF